MVIEMKKLDQQLTDVNMRLDAQSESDPAMIEVLSQDRERLHAELAQLMTLMAQQQKQMVTRNEEHEQEADVNSCGSSDGNIESRSSSEAGMSDPVDSDLDDEDEDEWGGPDGEVDEEEELLGAPFDLTAVPVALDAKLLALDPEGALRPTTIAAGPQWSKRSFKSLLTPTATTEIWNSEEQSRNTKAAFDLLDALTRSGGLSLVQTELHVLMAATHNFDLALIDTSQHAHDARESKHSGKEIVGRTRKFSCQLAAAAHFIACFSFSFPSVVFSVVQGNVNPIEKVERSSLILASAVHGVLPQQLIRPAERERVNRYADVGFGLSMAP
jgi:hypothetical protein